MFLSLLYFIYIVSVYKNFVHTTLPPNSKHRKQNNASITSHLQVNVSIVTTPLRIKARQELKSQNCE